MRIWKRAGAVVPAGVTVALLISAVLSVPSRASAPSPASTVPLPAVTGPLPDTATSHFFDQTPIDIAAYGYIEQEYFVRGTANVYDYDSAGKVVVKFRNVPYVNRIIVARPADPRRFSGTVWTEIMNMTNGWDLDKTWEMSHDQLMADGDVYVGVTSAPNTVAALKKFDPARYAALSWAAPAGDTCSGTALNSSATTEGGLVWDIFSQVGAALKSRAADNPLHGLRVRKVYATGYSQSANYLIRYIDAINPVAHVYDGFLIGAAPGLVMPLGKCSAPISLTSPLEKIVGTSVPTINIHTQTDFYMDGGNSRRPDSDTATNKYRLYDVPGASHSSQYTTAFVPPPADLAKIGYTYHYYDCPVPGESNTFPTRYIFNGAEVNLDRWARFGIAPPSAAPIEVDAHGNAVVDAYGNALGGVRTPWVDVPTMTYYPNSGSLSTSLSCFLFGHQVPFSTSQLVGLYPNHGAYTSRFIAEVYKLIAERWLTLPDAQAAADAAADSSIPR